jgi:hypothetical protein
VAKAAR